MLDRRAYIVERIFDLRQEQKQLTEEQLRGAINNR
jgi:hypothetical protein